MVSGGYGALLPGLLRSRTVKWVFGRPTKRTKLTSFAVPPHRGSVSGRALPYFFSGGRAP
jgi:hypothetical protein